MGDRMSAAAGLTLAWVPVSPPCGIVILIRSDGTGMKRVGTEEAFKAVMLSERIAKEIMNERMNECMNE